jgi:inhibitor of KinA
MPAPPKHTIFPVGDYALTIDFGNRIDESTNLLVLSLFRSIQENPLPGMIEAVPAYSSLTLYYDLIGIKKIVPRGSTALEWMSDQLCKRLQNQVAVEEPLSRLVKIPVCFAGEFSKDIGLIAAAKKISPENIIEWFLAKTYRVYLLGFLPGFAYMGEIDQRISMPRKHQPEPVVAGSVGIAGMQTGIYPLTSPGGWHVIGRTPVKLFDAEKEELTFLKAGDRVQFISISKDEFENY